MQRKCIYSLYFSFKTYPRLFGVHGLGIIIIIILILMRVCCMVNKMQKKQHRTESRYSGPPCFHSRYYNFTFKCLNDALLRTVKVKYMLTPKLIMLNVEQEFRTSGCLTCVPKVTKWNKTRKRRIHAADVSTKKLVFCFLLVAGETKVALDFSKFYFRPSFFNPLDHFWYNSVIESTTLSNLRNFSLFISGFHHRSCQGH